jgi:hypothetical protein
MKRSSVNIAYKLTNVGYIPCLTEESTKEYNADEYMPLYSPVSRNVELYSLVTF